MHLWYSDIIKKSQEDTHMTYQEVLAAAREAMSPYCKACPVCNGRACGNHIPGPGS